MKCSGRRTGIMDTNPKVSRYLKRKLKILIIVRFIELGHVVFDYQFNNDLVAIQ